MSKSILIAIILIGILMIGFFELWPKYQDFKAIRLEIGQKSAELQNKEDYFLEIEKIAKELTNYKEELSKIDAALPADSSLPSLFNFLQTAVSQNGLVLEGIGASAEGSAPAEAGAAAGGASIKDIGISLKVSGSYTSLKNFLSVLEKTSRLIEVENISFSSPQEKEKPFSFDLQMKTHSY